MVQYPKGGIFDFDPITLARIHAPKVLFVVSAVSVYFFYTTGRRAMMFPVIGGMLAGITGWLVIRRQYPDFHFGTAIEPGVVMKTLTRPRLSYSFILLYIAAILVLYTNSLYARPVIAYPLHGLAFAYLALQIYFNSSKVHNLLQLFLLSVGTYWSTQLLFPSGHVSNSSHIRWGERILQLGYVPQSYTYSGHPGFAMHSGILAEITAIGNQTAYVLLAVVTVAGTVFVIGSFDRSIPSLSPQPVLFAALLFATATFTLNRGLQPHTTSFFYVHTALLLGVIFASVSGRLVGRFLFVGVLAALAATFGHTFSAGAPAVILLFGLPLFVVYHLLPIKKPKQYAVGVAGGVIAIYSIVFFAHQVYYQGGGHIFGRAAGFIQSISVLLIETDSGSGTSTTTTDTGTTGGFYAELPPETLFQATFGDLIWFLLLFTGICVLLAKDRYDLDLLSLIIIGGFMFLAAGVVIHGSDIPAQRIYQVVITFGGCIAAGIGVLSLTNATPKQVRAVGLCSIIFLFAAFSLFSPVANMALSPLAVPASHSSAFSGTGAEWTGTFADGERFSSNEFVHVDDRVVEIDHTAQEDGTLYVYDSVQAESGFTLTRASEFGEAESAFAQPSSEMKSDKIVYDNGKVESLRSIR